jgi:hypothetical protein
MREIDVPLPPSPDFAELARLIEGAVAAEGLRVASVDTLRTYPGSTHWHIKRGDDAGTLEITLWPKGRRLWFKVQSARDAAWIADVLPRLQAAILPDIAAQ